jgi:hypothetical protein
VVAEAERQARAEERRRAEDEALGLVARFAAVHEPNQPSNYDYQEACADMEEDVREALQGWHMGSGL